jgi:predicted transcriptional regulator
MTESLSAPRDRILSRLERDPGLHLRELPRRLDLSLRAVRYHLEVLERDDAVTAHRSGRFERWFPGHAFSRQDRAVISALRVRGERTILELLLARGPCRFADLRGSARASPGSLVRHLNHLTAEGLLRIDGDRRYRLVEPEALRSRVTTFRLRFPDLLSDAAQEIFDEGR